LEQRRKQVESELEEITITGLVSKILERYVVTTDDGTEYVLSAIMPYEAVSPDYNSHIFAERLGMRVRVSGVTDGHTIWRAFITEEK
jgi:hypothetical protein